MYQAHWVFIMEDYTCMNGVLCCDCNIIIFYLQCKRVGPNVGRLCTMEEVGPFNTNFYAEITFCRQTSWYLKGYAWTEWQFRVAWPRLHIPSQSSPPLLPTLSNPQPSAVSPQNSNVPVLPPLPLTSELPPEENNLQVLPPLRTYSKLPLSSTRIENPLPIHTDGPSTSSPISVPNPKQAAANIFCGRHLLVPQLRFFHCFWWGIRVLQWPKFFLEA